MQWQIKCVIIGKVYISNRSNKKSITVLTPPILASIYIIFLQCSIAGVRGVITIDNTVAFCTATANMVKIMTLPGYQKFL